MRETTLPVIVLKLPRTPRGVLYYAMAVHQAMDGNPLFPAPRPPLAKFAADIDDLAVAEAHCLTRTKGAAQARDAKAEVVRGDLESLRVYVQGVANASALGGLGIIESAHMSAKHTGMTRKGFLEIKDGPLPGTVHVVARAVARQASYEWQYSQDGESWIDLEPTLQADTRLSGLARGVVYSFRYRALYRGGRGDYSQAVSHRVV